MSVLKGVMCQASGEVFWGCQGGFLGMSGGVSEVSVGGGMGKEQGNL